MWRVKDSKSILLVLEILWAVRLHYQFEWRIKVVKVFGSGDEEGEVKSRVLQGRGITDVLKTLLRRKNLDVVCARSLHDGCLSRF